MKALDFLPLEKAIGGAANEVALALEVNRRQVMHWRSVGVDEDQARALAELAGFEAGVVWPELANGTAPKAETPAPVEDDGLVWCDPPPIRRPRESRWVPRLAPLVDRPDEWARVAVYANKQQAYGAANSLRRNKARTPPGRWVFRSGPANEACSSYGVWARWLGPDE